ncbi:centrosomal protein of 44 kDa [Pempheris klunzingeri]|uniref:centrosomal protein of 44 kDa n=1 Tax=Pempheris klunzingeri TaxID=3127111 RepID=UPI0039803431
MLSAGDVQGSLRKLETLLRAIKYPGLVDYDGLSKGDPSAFLPVVSYSLTSFSPPFAEQLMAAGLELTGKTDLRFTDALYKALRDVFHYKPVLTKQQFLQWGFSQRKISVVCDIINLVLQKHNHLRKPRLRCPASHKVDGGGDAHPALTPAETLSDVVNHAAENPSTSPTYPHHAEAFSPSPPATELAGVEDQETADHSSEVGGRLSALEAQMESLLPGLHRLSVLEKRLEELERRTHTHKNEGQVITISRDSWENLLSRVLLLETKVDLSSAQTHAPPACPSPASSCSCSSVTDASKEDLKERLERISNMLKSTSSLLKNPEPFTAPCK